MRLTRRVSARYWKNTGSVACRGRTVFCDGKIIDVTMPPSNPVAEPKRFIHEEIIAPDYKVMMHRAFVARWLAQLGRDDLDIEQLWRIREHCIAALSAPRPRLRRG